MPRSALARPVLAVDVVLFRLQGAELAVLLYRREAEPFSGAWALPGVALRADETLLAAARRALEEKGGLVPATVESLHLEQLATFDAVFRDPRGRTVSVAHVGLMPPGAQGGASVWRPVSRVDAGSLPFDHATVLDVALTRLRGKLRYTNIAARLLPEAFRIDELQMVYEAVLGRRLNRANFRTKLLRIGLIERAGVLADAVGAKGGRPPHLYRFAAEQVEAKDRDFL